MSLFATKREAFEHNISIMKTMEHPVVLIKALHSGPGAVNVPADDTENIDPIMFLCTGSRIMLVANLWPEAGQCNWAMGTVVDIIYKVQGMPVQVLWWCVILLTMLGPKQDACLY